MSTPRARARARYHSISSAGGSIRWSSGLRMSVMAFDGHFVTHRPQPMHFASLITLRPSPFVIALIVQRVSIHVSHCVHFSGSMRAK